MTARQRSISVALQQRPLRQTPGGRGTGTPGDRRRWAARRAADYNASGGPGLFPEADTHRLVRALAAPW